MIYGTGGYADARLQGRSTSTGQVFAATRERHNGWFAGGGVEMFVTKFLWSDVIFGIDYKHIELDTKHHRSFLNDETYAWQATVDIVSARLIFKWGSDFRKGPVAGKGPVVARN